MNAMQVLIVEDDPLHRSYLNEAVRSALPECDMVIEAENGSTGERLARENKSAHIVMDLQMNARNGIEAARTIWKERPDTRILFWSNYADEAYVRGVSRIVPEGAAYGYVLKSASDDRLKLALRAIFIESQCVIAGGLTDSEYEVLLDVALGLTDSTIARRRNLSLRSVQNRLQQLYAKLGVYKPNGPAGEASRINLRARAVAVAILRKVLNVSSLEREDRELQAWLAKHGE
jgi:DNA-binding NarL/FixJ family response regulator